MTNFKKFTTAEKNQRVQLRLNEIKIGERIHYPKPDEEIFEFIKFSQPLFMMFGIPEDIGIKANFGRVGARDAWDIALNALLNAQHNKTCKGNYIGVLGTFDFSEWQEEADQLDPKVPAERRRLMELVALIDKEVAYLVAEIVSLGKIPIIIGGGHNNAYGAIKGLAIGKNSAVNVINFDAHTDFRPLEGRHSGNGFTYAFEENFLKKYFIFGLHENYTSKSVFNTIKQHNETIKYNTFEQMKVRLEKDFSSELHVAYEHIKKLPYGIEIDLDSVEMVASSAMSPSGFSSVELRQFIHYMALDWNSSYIHICEAAPSLDQAENKHLTGKLIAYLITDFIKSRMQRANIIID